MSITFLYHDNTSVKTVRGSKFCQCLHQPCLCDAPDEPCVVILIYVEVGFGSKSYNPIYITFTERFIFLTLIRFF